MIRPRRSPVRSRPRLFLEELEARTLLSASILDTLAAAPQAVLNPASQASVSDAPQNNSGHGPGGGGGGGGGGGVTNPNPIGYNPSQVQTAYGFNQISFNNGSIKGDGSGQTIAIVDAYNDPNIASDLSTFDAEFGLPGASLTIAKPAGRIQTNSGWALETSLDVEWAHAMAPGANILLVEAQSNSLSNLLNAVSYASQHASVVSMSWGGGEFSTETSYDSYFSQPGVTYVASSGDQGAPPSWPAVSPNVVAVGGTSLTTDSAGNYLGETGWSGSGGGISAYEAKPGYQSSVTQSSTQRTNPDVAYNADPNTGFAVYDTVSYAGQTGWFEVGGTSAGAPQWSALVAIADQGRALAGSGSLNGVGQTLPALYNMSANDFHDITTGTSTGSPNYSAGPGYDLVTGRGTPIANSVVQALVSATGTGSVGSGMATTSSTSAPNFSASSHNLVGGTDTPSSSGIVSSTGPAVTVTVAVDPVVLTQPTRTSEGADSSFTLAAFMPSLAFGTGQTSAAFTTNSTSFMSSQTAAVPGWQIYAPGSRSVSTPSAAFSSSLGPWYLFESPDSLPRNEADDAGDLFVEGALLPHQAVFVPGQGDNDLDLAPAVSAKRQCAGGPACDACFLDEAGMALIAEETLTSMLGADVESASSRVSGLALLGVLAGSLWQTPRTAEESRKRRGIVL